MVWLNDKGTTEGIKGVPFLLCYAGLGEIMSV